MTGLKEVENQRAFEAAHAQAMDEPAAKLLQEIYSGGYLNMVGAANLQERVRVYLATGVLTGQYTPSK